MINKEKIIMTADLVVCLVDLSPVVVLNLFCFLSDWCPDHDSQL